MKSLASNVWYQEGIPDQIEKCFVIDVKYLKTFLDNEQSLINNLLNKKITEKEFWKLREELIGRRLIYNE